ncbi:hypothetical protein [Kineococcus radiotolerans]|uniref:Uncharacterized protein n=1 Tax=Kineococcus radiotolerans (strain ATCC BAA-149 / DSM 14245 / SRS30216) TaxID=266940 RepID=A6WH53_KINRD|nr:hypothetical protein [Kineococcus radiotolerans]ABS06142.1 hypothetical protein Krad_4684 [Kineococcus radiotolerans SRS30216 = ATCC BAA-149]
MYFPTSRNAVKLTVEAVHERGKTTLAPDYTSQVTGSEVRFGPFVATRKTAAEAREAVAEQVTTWAAAAQTEGMTPVTVTLRGWTTVAWLAPEADGPSWQSITIRPDGSHRSTSSYRYVPRAELDAKLRLNAVKAALDPHDDADVSEGIAFVGRWGGQPHDDAVAEFRRWVGFQCAYVAHRAEGHDDQAAHDFACRNDRVYAPTA